MYSDVMSPSLSHRESTPNLTPKQQINNEKVTMIQSAIRGFLAKELYGKTKIDSQSLFVFDRADRLLRSLTKTSERVEQNWEKSLISQTEEVETIGALEKVKNDVVDLAKDLRSKNGVKLSSYKSVADYCDQTFSRIVNAEVDYDNVLMTAGFSSLQKAVDYLRESSQEIILSSKARKLIKQYDLLFTPKEMTIFDGDPLLTIEDPVLFKSENSMNIFVKKEDLLSDIPVLKRIEKPNPFSRVETFQGAELHFAAKNQKGKHFYVIVKGSFKKDALNMAQTCPMIKERLMDIETEFLDNIEIPSEFVKNYLDQYPARELLLKTKAEVVCEIQEDYEYVKTASAEPIKQFMCKFENFPLIHQVRILSIFLSVPDKKMANMLYHLYIRDNRDLRELLRATLHYTLVKKLNFIQEEYKNNHGKFLSRKSQKVTYDDRIFLSNMDDATKEKAYEKLKSINDRGNEADKCEKYLDALLKVPFGIYSPETVTKESNPLHIKAYLDKVKSDLNDAVYGQDKSKTAIMEWLAQRISNGESKGECIALEGPPGTGKTTFAREGIAKALGRPFAFISMAGQKDGADLVGHGYTYIGSIWGRFVEILMECGRMDPVIYFDEVDKISESGKAEIEGILTALTDFSQNGVYNLDKYFSGVKFDFSRVLFVFSYNDSNKINSILKDRMQIIKIEPLSQKDKLQVARNHLLPEILKSCGFSEEDILIDDEEIKFISENYTFEAGARKLKENLYSIVRQINLKRLYEPDSIKLPFKIDQKAIIEFRDEPKEDFQKIASEPLVGTINGLYATGAGIGGITVVQAYRTIGKEPLELILTGSQGDVMRESMSVARTVALNLIPESRRGQIHEPFLNGLHIHCPEGSMPKDGPSAGGAITTAIVSQLTGIPIRNDVAMTGEIDLRGRITKIGGLVAKLHGAKKAGVKLALVPKENLKDLEKIQKKFPELIDDTFEVRTIETIKEALDIALVSKLV